MRPATAEGAGLGRLAPTCVAALTLTLTLTLFALAPASRLAVGAEQPAGSPLSREALALCLRTHRTAVKAKMARLERGLGLAEKAVAADERDAMGHFAIFCNLGKRMQLDGLSLRSVTALRRARRAVDRALELAPDYTDALIGKGGFLTELPRLLGGDPREGERLLRRALAVDADHFDARLMLARALAAQGRRGEAAAEARRALAIAERESDGTAAAEARALLAELEK